MKVLENAGFGENFIKWIKFLVLNKESSVFNAGSSTGYFKLGRGCRQGDPISAYLYILVIEIFFVMVRDNQAIEGLNIINFEYKLTSYADDSTFFLKKLSSVDKLIDTFNIFSRYSGLELNTNKCEICSIGMHRETEIPYDGLKCINLSTSSIKILGISYSYNQDIFLGIFLLL
jgi:hypothetical protein